MDSEGVVMDVASVLTDQLHGWPIGRGSVDVVCDIPHEAPRAIDCDRRVQYECCVVGDSMTVFEGYSIIGVWHPDLLRCPDCEIESLPDPTNGFGEALVELDITWQNQQRVLDTHDLTVLDYSPVDEGTEPPRGIPWTVLQTAIKRGDWGTLRRSRLRRQMKQYRQRGAEDLADAIEQRL
ncbi:hypothetical protein HWV23_15435 [Natronomonas halophila]|uniref:hypothetical protein n=1 Tax=Natronomonas halophila TaxID=2747817 RepID=UPI0015B7411A|nr:hypothetical protein [Natronomonas halophila]QLD87056.1 hypothetical protein HWV23_15435 [Natronomonas halophila]